jgi:hypothetical protein
MGNLLPDDGTIETFKDAVEWFLKQSDYKKPKVAVLAEIYQGSNDLFPDGAEFSGDPNTDVESGVCQGMAVEWIRMCGLGVAGGAKGFRRKVKGDWEIFAETQIAIRHSKRCTKAFRQDLFARVEAWNKAKRQLKADKNASKKAGRFKRLVNPHQRRGRIDRRNQSLVGEGAEIASELQTLQSYPALIYANRVFAGDADAGQCEIVASELTFAGVGPALIGDQGNFPAYYMVTLSGDRGHTFAVHTTQKARLMDANTCEFEFGGPTAFYGFFKDYLQIYERLGFEDGKLRLYRFDIPNL